MFNILAHSFGTGIGGDLAMRPVLVLTALLALGSAVQADSPPSPALPSLALDPLAPPPSIWKGLYVGTDIFFESVKGSKGLVGGGAFIGYDKRFDNNLVLGVQASTGYAPSLFQHSGVRG